MEENKLLSCGIRVRNLMFLCALLVTLPCFTFRCIAAQSDIFNLPAGTERICLSLRVLSEKVSNAMSEKSRLPDDVLNLYGLGYIEGFIVDETEDKDIILFGQRSPKRPSLNLDDLIVNMRCAGGLGDYPYCSLDPQPKDIRAIQALFATASTVNTPSEMTTFFQELKSVVGPQQVVVGGVPKNSRHAHVMIDADYHMKKVSQGYISLPEVTSYLDSSLEQAKVRILKGNSASTGGISMARFWFHIEPNYPTFQEGKQTIWLEKCPVTVLTEKQMTTPSGQLYDVKEDDMMAIAFAEELSKNFPKLTQIVPFYADLENLFRLRALLLAMKHHATLDVIGKDFRSYVSEYRYQSETPMDSSLPGLANSREWSHSVITGNMTYDYYLFPMVCGGVGMDMEVKTNSFSRTESAKLLSFHAAVLLARPSRDSLMWVVPATL